jgi:protein-tyrosine sulfotransferase
MIIKVRQVLHDLILYKHIPLSLMRWLDWGRNIARIGHRYPLSAPDGMLSCRPLFIVSSGRSGTTLLRSMLAAGGLIAIPPETQVIPLSIRRFYALQYLGWEDLSRLIIALFESHRHFPIWQVNLGAAYQVAMSLPESERSLARIIEEVFRCYASQQFPEADIWGDQSPLNTLYLPWIKRTFPHGRYLHLLRDGRDMVASMMDRGGTSLEQSTWRWITSVKNAIDLQRQLPAEQFLEVRYEDLVSAPEPIMELICQFIEIDYRPIMLDFWKSPTTLEHRYHSFHRNLDRPVFTDSIGKWRTRLTSNQQAYVLAKTKTLLKQLGYA